MDQNHYEIIEDEGFLKDKEKYSRKYPSLIDDPDKNDIERYKKVLRANPNDGRLRKTISEGVFLYKSDIFCKSLGKGQRGGMQVWFVRSVSKMKIYLVLMYPKSDESAHEVREIRKALEYYNNLGQ